jgi:ribose transport system substrate-binding protein
MKKKIIAVILMASLGVVSCTMQQSDRGTASNSPVANTTGELKSGRGKKIGFSIAMLAGSPFWQVLSDELGKGLRALEYDFVVLDGQGDVAKQTSDVEDLISQKVDMILINPYDSKAIVPVTLRARDAGIPVMAVDIPIDESGYSIATCICDNKTIGYNLGWYAAGLFDRPNVRAIVISGYPGGIDSYDRRFGFIEGFHNRQLERFNRTGLEIIFHGWGDYDFNPSNKTMEDALVRTKGDFDILYAENDPMAMGGLKAMDDAGVKGKIIIGVDSFREMLELIKEDRATATALNSPVELGSVSVDAIHKYLNGIEIPKWNFTTPDVIDKSNVDRYYNPNSPF